MPETVRHSYYCSLKHGSLQTRDDGEAPERPGDVRPVPPGPGVVNNAAAPGGEEQNAAHQAQQRVLNAMLEWETESAQTGTRVTIAQQWVGGSQSKNRIGWEQSSDTDRSPGEPVPEDDAKDGGGEDDQPRNQGPHP